MEEKEFLLICKERAIAEELDNCVTGTGVSYFYRHFYLHSTFILSQLVQMKSGKVVTVKLMVMSHVNEAVSKIRRWLFIRDFRVLCRTQSYEQYSSRLI